MVGFIQEDVLPEGCCEPEEGGDRGARSCVCMLLALTKQFGASAKRGFYRFCCRLRYD